MREHHNQIRAGFLEPGPPESRETPPEPVQLEIFYIDATVWWLIMLVIGVVLGFVLERL